VGRHHRRTPVSRYFGGRLVPNRLALTRWAVILARRFLQRTIATGGEAVGSGVSGHFKAMSTKDFEKNNVDNL
jgi:hypothetical protein